MTKSEKAAEYGMILVNGRMRFFSRISSFKSLGNGKFEATRNDVTYRIEGGKKMGGTRRDWFLDSPNWNKAIVCTSLVDALNVVDGM